MADVREIDKYVEQIKTWMQQMQPFIDKFGEDVRNAQEARQRVEDENLRITDERRQAEADAAALAARELHATKWVPINSLCKKMDEMDAELGGLDERVTDLEMEIDRVREEAAEVKEVVTLRLVELGYLQPDASARDAFARMSVEDGEVPFEPPPPPKSNEELTEECEQLVKRLAAYHELVVQGLQQIDEWRQRNITKERSYHELAADNANLQLTMGQVRVLLSCSYWRTLTLNLLFSSWIRASSRLTSSSSKTRKSLRSAPYYNATRLSDRRSRLRRRRPTRLPRS